MNINVSQLKKLAGGLKVISALVSLALVYKYDKIQTDKYITFGNRGYDWEK